MRGDRFNDELIKTVGKLSRVTWEETKAKYPVGSIHTLPIEASEGHGCFITLNNTSYLGFIDVTGFDFEGQFRELGFPTVGTVLRVKVMCFNDRSQQVRFSARLCDVACGDVN